MELTIIVDAMVPPLPGSVLKMQGRPAAKSPFDTSETERWGIKRVSSPDGEELYAKEQLYKHMSGLKEKLDPKEREYVYYAYDKELPIKSVKREMSIDSREAHRLREAVISKTWDQVKPIKHILEPATR